MKLRDGLDYANNRYYSNAYGRFMTPDPYEASGGPAAPQSWNRYAYTRGDPVNRVDPSGEYDVDPEACVVAGDYDASIQCDFDDSFMSTSTPGPPNPYQILSVVRSLVATAAAAWLLTNESQTSASASIPTFLKMSSECWLPDSGPGSLQSASYTLFVTYQILNQNDQPMSGASLSGISISETITPLRGYLTAGPPWQYGTQTGIQPEGTFTDLLSSNSLPQFPNNITALQQFTATGTVNGVPIYQPLQIMGFGPTTPVLLNVYSPNNVSVNGRSIGNSPATKCQ